MVIFAGSVTWMIKIITRPLERLITGKPCTTALVITRMMKVVVPIVTVLVVERLSAEAVAVAVAVVLFPVLVLKEALSIVIAAIIMVPL